MRFRSQFFNYTPISITENQNFLEERYEHNLYLIFSKYQTEITIRNNERSISIFKPIWIINFTKDICYLFYLYNKTHTIKTLRHFQ